MNCSAPTRNHFSSLPQHGHKGTLIIVMLNSNKFRFWNVAPVKSFHGVKGFTSEKVISWKDQSNRTTFLCNKNFTLKMYNWPHLWLNHLHINTKKSNIYFKKVLYSDCTSSRGESIGDHPHLHQLYAWLITLGGNFISECANIWNRQKYETQSSGHLTAAWRLLCPTLCLLPCLEQQCLMRFDNRKRLFASGGKLVTF